MANASSDGESTPPRRRTTLLRAAARWLLRAAGDPSAAVTDALDAREERGEAIEEAQKDMIIAAARFDTLKVSDVMRPRADIVAIEADATLGEAAQLFSASQHSRLPVFGETLDEPLGLVHVRDVLALLSPGEDGQAKAKFSDKMLMRIKRDILCVPPSMKLPALFLRMQSSRSHLALVIDEYGGTDGLVSMEDLVEQIVGDIDDEHDVEAPLVQARGGGFEADGRASVEALADALQGSLALEDHDGDFDTAAGLAVALAGRVPQRGEILHHPSGFDIEIVDADARRVKRLRVKPVDPPAKAAAAQKG